MDVTGSRLDQMKMLVSKEDQHKNSQCDKQMKVQCNENYQRPSWLKGNTKSSSWPTPKVEKEYSCADKENVDPRVPFKNIYNNQNQDKKDGFDIKDVVNETVDDDEISPIISSPKWPNWHEDSESLTEGSPMVMSSLFSGRIIFDASDNLSSLNDENGASPMFNLQNNPFRVKQIDKSISSNSSDGDSKKKFGSILTQSGANSYHGRGSNARSDGYFESKNSALIHSASENNAPRDAQKPCRSTGKRLSFLNQNNSVLSPVSRINSEYVSGFKRPLLLFPSPQAKNSCPDKNVVKQSKTNPVPNDLCQKPCHELNLNQGSAKRFKKDTQGMPPLLKSHSMSALCQMPLLDFGEIEQTNTKNCASKSRKDLVQQNSRLCRSKSFMDPAAAARVMDACRLAELDSNRTGDTRLKLLLPIVQGHSKNSDLKNVDCHTLARLLNGEFKENIARCRIIDARYCYEYEGGHIKGAENFGMWEEETFLAEFFPPSLQEKPLTPKPLKSNDLETKENESDNTEAEKRDILVFHCEFSSARGPALMRLMRKKDREINKATYPALHYPECYLLHDGYKAFYEAYPQLCNGSYLPMKHPQFAHEERKFHKKSKSWAAGGGGTISRTGASSRLLKL